MRILDFMAREGFEQVVALTDPSCGLAGFMVLHNTSRGPAAGGIRLFPYQNEESALADGFKLARAMTFKAAAADLPVGGGKIVLIDNADLVRKEALRAVGRAIQSLGGRFLAGRDIGVSVEQGAWVRNETQYMVDETDRGVGDLNRATALGVEAGARAALRFCFGVDDWNGIRVAIQGAGGVGQWLARILADEGAELAVSDLNEKNLEKMAERTSFETVAPEEIYCASRDVFCPCAVGGILNEHTTNKLMARIVAGSANNVLSEPSIGKALHQRGISYVPDSLISAGALIQGIRFLLTGQRESHQAIAQIGDRTQELLATAAASNEPPCEVFDRDTRRKIGPQQNWRRWAWPSI